MTVKAKVGIIFPQQDQASMTIWNELEKNGYCKVTEEKIESTKVCSLVNFENEIKFIFSNKDGVETNHLEEIVEVDYFIIASRHRAASGKPALLIHPTGNWNEATLAGNPHQLSYTSSQMLKVGYLKLKEKQEEYDLREYTVDLEVTHHGPTDMKTPLCFMELGSSEQYWKDQKAALATGEAIIETAKEIIKGSIKGESYVGFGGNHYAYQFQKYTLKEEFASVGHIAPKYQIDTLTESIIQEAFMKTIENPKVALIDKKGVNSPQRKHIEELLKTLEIDFSFI